jgi:hypothetical protein
MAETYRFAAIGAAPRRRKSRSKANAKQRAVEGVSALAEVLSQDRLEEIATAAEAAADTVRAVGDQEAISPLTGEPLPSADEVGSAYVSQLFAGFALRRQLLAHALGASDVAKLLGARNRQTANQRARARTLLAIRDNGSLHFPHWQFDPEGPDGVLEGLPATLQALPMRSDVARAIWFLTPKQQLRGRTPLEALRGADQDAVLAEAEAAQLS